MIKPIRITHPTTELTKRITRKRQLDYVAQTIDVSIEWGDNPYYELDKVATELSKLIDEEE